MMTKSGLYDHLGEHPPPIIDLRGSAHFRGAPYDKNYFDRLRAGTRRSAQVVVPLLINIFRPRSVVDVGCGTGVWLSAFEERGIKDIFGIDGPWVDREQLEIVRDRFLVHDLTAKFSLGRSFDLVLCLEVAEHLPPESGATLVETLSSLGRIIAFSAAIPRQGGESHLNEAWPEYWVDLFARRNYECFDGLRNHLWWHPEVEIWYRQNILIYTHRESKHTIVGTIAASLQNNILSAVHPELFELKITQLEDRAQRLNEDWQALLVERRQLREQNADLQYRLDAAESRLARISRFLPWKILRAARHSTRYVKQAWYTWLGGRR
jgi:SAM-dependent methyltransferase